MARVFLAASAACRKTAKAINAASQSAERAVQTNEMRTPEMEIRLVVIPTSIDN